MAVPVGFLSTQRTNELEADYFAVQAMARAGFDPNALVDYTQRVQLRQAERFSPLPNRAERLNAMRRIMGDYRRPIIRQPRANSSRFSNEQLLIFNVSDSPFRRALEFS